MKLYTSNKGVFPDDWKIVKLGSLCDLQNGYAFKSTDYVDSSNTLSCRMSNIRPDGEFDLDYHPKFLPDPYADKYQQFLLKDNDVIIAMTDMATEPKILGVPTVVSTKGRNVLLNQRVGKLVIKDKDSIFFPYLKRVLGTNRAKQHYLRFAGGGVQINLSKEDLLSLEIPLPPIEEQRRIAAILDKADGVRRKRKEAIRLTEELLKSTFLEMFGDPVTNPKGWEVKTIEDITVNQKGAIKRGPFGGALKKDIFIQAGFLVYEQYHALNNDFSFERYYISEDKFEEMKGFEVKPGDIIISCSGVYLGKLAIVPENAKPGIINQALLRITLNQRKMNNYFFLYHFSHESFRDKFFAANRGSGVPNFPPISEFKTFPFIVPPIEDQNKFSARLQQIQGFQSKAYESIKESENLFNSLLQRAFRGEL